MLQKIVTIALFILTAVIPLSAESEGEKEIARMGTIVSAAEGSKKTPSRFTCTAYSLSSDDCGKPPDHPYYGITAAGVSLKNKSHKEAMAVAVDPDVIAMGTKLLVIFNDKAVADYSGVYTAVDRGGAIVGSRLDIFIPDTAECRAFGIRSADVYIL